MPTIGSLFSGYGGLDLAVEEVLGARTSWVSDIDKGACAILDKRFGVPNLGDITKVDWVTAPAVDILTGGFPCQDVSHAGLRAGLQDGTRSGLWAEMARAIDGLRPQLVVIENVRGLLSAKTAESQDVVRVGPNGGRRVERTRRALGTVPWDLAQLRYDARWYGLRAADVGAPHGRFRIFIVAEDANGSTRSERGLAAPGQAESGRAWPDAGRRGGAPAAHASSERHGSRQDGGGVGLLDREDEGRAFERERPREVPLDRGAEAWGEYADAICRWERVLGRRAPAATEPGRTGQRLSPRFVEWMMGLPEDWVTEVPGLTRNAQLKALGNGVVPQQAAAALRVLL